MKREGKWVWESVGNDANTAHSKMLAGPIPLIASKAQDKESGTPIAKDGYCIDDEIAVYLSNAAKLSSKTYKAYKLSLGLFRQSCKKIYVHQITKQDLQAFDSDLLETAMKIARGTIVSRIWSFSYETRKVAASVPRSRM